MPKVSVILPVFNARPTLRDAIASVLWQTATDFELIVIDNGSTDGSDEIAKSLCKENARCRLIRENRKGIVHALNTGIREAKGDYIARMDADDLCHRERLEKQLEQFQEFPQTGLVASRVDYGDRISLAAYAQKNGMDPKHLPFSDPPSTFRRLEPDRSTEGYRIYVDWINSIVSEEQIYQNRFIESPFAHPSVMFRKTLMERFGPYRQGPFPEDYELWLRWMEHGVPMRKVRQSLLYWSDPPDRLSRTDPAYDRNAFFQIKGHYLFRFLLQRSHAKIPPEVGIIGSSRLTRKRIQPLVDMGLRVKFFVDFQGRKTSRYTVIPWEELPAPGEVFLISYVASRGARSEIRKKLNDLGYKEMMDYLIAA